MADNKPRLEIPGIGAIQTLKFGPGVVGRSAPIPIAFAVVILVAIAAVRDHPELVMVLVAVAFVACAAAIGAFIWYGHHHPESALLEGGQAVAYQKLLNEQAAMKTTIIEGKSHPIANNAPTSFLGGS
jgi:hypothetical protein